MRVRWGSVEGPLGSVRGSLIVFVGWVRCGSTGSPLGVRGAAFWVRLNDFLMISVHMSFSFSFVSNKYSIFTELYFF